MISLADWCGPMPFGHLVPDGLSDPFGGPFWLGGLVEITLALFHLDCRTLIGAPSGETSWTSPLRSASDRLFHLMFFSIERIWILKLEEL